MRFETKHMILRDYVQTDFKDYYRLKSDEQTMYYLQDIQLFSKEEALIDFENVLNDMKSKSRTLYFFHMEEKNSKEQIGSVGFHVLTDTPVGKNVQLGYFMYPKFWGHGYMSEAVKKVLEIAFLQEHVYRITTGCLSENIGSKRVLEKNGLIKEATHVGFEWHDGKLKDRLEYRLLKEEWTQ